MLGRFWPLWVAILAGVAIAPARADEITAEEVRSAIQRGTEYLLRPDNRNAKGGLWSDHVPQTGAVTSLCTLALLNAGTEVRHPVIQSALKYLRTLPPDMTYATALQTMVFCAAEPKKDLLLIGRNAKWLEAKQIRGGEKSGAWSYPSQGGGDNSNSQFALMALYEAERAGVAVNPTVWRLAHEYWRDCQNNDGSWGYLRGDPRASSGTGSMTCAGITAMIITAGELNLGDAEARNGRLQCCGEQRENTSVERGLDWLAGNFSVSVNPGSPQRFLLYYLYGVERVGRMTAHRFIGKHDWYREGAEKLVREQDSFSGYWKGVGHSEDNPLIGTSLALLFLAKGRRPVLIGKLMHDPPGDWNHHRSDLANLTAYTERRWGRDLTWQIVDPAKASVEDLLQSPVLFFNGRESPRFTPEEKRNLRDYIDRGGFLFAESCCGGAEFDAGFRELMVDIFPEAEYKLRLLPMEHPVWHAEEPVDPDHLRKLWGIDVGCRTSVVYCEGDLSCQWELSRPGRETPFPAEIKADIAAANSIGINVLAYATNRELKFKYDQFKTPVVAAEDKFDRGKLYVANIQHQGGCNAAPAALSNLLRTAGEKLKLRISPEPRDLNLTDPQLFNYTLVFMHGRNSFRFTPQERKHLKDYFERGGVLLADSICSSKEFTAAFRREIKSVLPEQPLERIPVNHSLFGVEYGGADLGTVQRRQPLGGAAGGAMRVDVRDGEPYLEGVTIGDRLAVIFSPYDLSCALETRASLDCEGYTQVDAARLGLNAILYSLHQ